MVNYFLLLKQTKRFLKRSAPSFQHETLSDSLLRALPNLLVKFKSDLIILESLANLPRYLNPTVFSLPQRRADFVHLVKHLCEIYLQSNDESVLYQNSLSIVFLCDKDHARSPEVKAVTKKKVSQLHGIITTDLLFNSK